MIIPGEGFDRENHPFDVPIMPEPSGSFWPKIGHQDRKVWAFQGPFERFLYLDADTICTKSLDQLMKRTLSQQGDFIYVQPWMDDQSWQSVIRDPCHSKHEQFVQHSISTIGHGPLAEFDPDHDFLSYHKFNTGVFASRRLAIKEADFRSLNRAEREFYRSALGVDHWTWRSQQLFFRDQGRINYLVRKLGIPTLPLNPALICEAGASAIVVSLEDVQRGVAPLHIIHWTGNAPSPSLFCSMPLFRIYALLIAFADRKNWSLCRSWI